MLSRLSTLSRPRRRSTAHHRPSLEGYLYRSPFPFVLAFSLGKIHVPTRLAPLTPMKSFLDRRRRTRATAPGNAASSNRHASNHLEQSASMANGRSERFADDALAPPPLPFARPRSRASLSSSSSSIRDISTPTLVSHSGFSTFPSNVRIPSCPTDRPKLARSTGN